MNEKESEEILNVLMNGQGTQVDRVHSWSEKKLKTQRQNMNIEWALLLVVLTLIYAGAWIQDRPVKDTRFEAYKQRTDSIVQEYQDSVSEFVNCVQNEVILKANNY